MTPTDFEVWLQITARYKEQIQSIERRFLRPFDKSLFLDNLASGESFTGLINTFKISEQSISAMIPEMCEDLISALKPNVKVIKVLL
jgi:hypothetical protein